jgi:hypothetical protein
MTKLPKEVVLTTRGGHQLVLSDGGDEILIHHPAGSTVKLDASGGIEIGAPSTVQIAASQVEVSAGVVQLQAGMVDASGVLKCDTLIANSVVASSYTPGAGNVW